MAAVMPRRVSRRSGVGRRSPAARSAIRRARAFGRNPQERSAAIDGSEAQASRQASRWAGNPARKTSADGGAGRGGTARAAGSSREEPRFARPAQGRCAPAPLARWLEPRVALPRCQTALAAAAGGHQGRAGHSGVVLGLPVGDVVGDSLLERLELLVELIGVNGLLRLTDEPWRGLDRGTPCCLFDVRDRTA